MQLNQIPHRPPRLGRKSTLPIPTQPDRSHPRIDPRLNIKLPIADHPTLLRLHLKLPACQQERIGIGLVWTIFAADTHLDRQRVPPQEGLNALAPITGYQGNTAAATMQILQHLITPIRQRRCRRYLILYSAQDILGLAPRCQRHQADALKDRGILGQSHESPNGREIERRHRQRPVHIKQDSLGKRYTI